MSNGEVARILLNPDGTISLVVRVQGFSEGAPIEISGEAVQDSGAAASFYSVQEMPAHDEEGDAILTLKSIPASSPNRFDPGFPIRVVTRVAQTGVTILGGNALSVGSVSHLEGSVPLLGAWEPDSYDPVRPEKRPPGPASGNGPVD